MTLADLVAQLPDETRVSVTIGSGQFTAGDLRRAFGAKGKVFLTTQEAAERWGWTAGYWRDVAPAIDGAFKDQYWHLPDGGCEAHVAAKSRRRREATSAPTPRARPQGLQKR
jgi:hypothetical protein